MLSHWISISVIIWSKQKGSSSPGLLLSSIIFKEISFSSHKSKVLTKNYMLSTVAGIAWPRALSSDPARTRALNKNKKVYSAKEMLRGQSWAQPVKQHQAQMKLPPRKLFCSFCKLILPILLPFVHSNEFWIKTRLGSWRNHPSLQSRSFDLVVCLKVVPLKSRIRYPLWKNPHHWRPWICDQDN